MAMEYRNLLYRFHYKTKAWLQSKQLQSNLVDININIQIHIHIHIYSHIHYVEAKFCRNSYDFLGRNLRTNLSDAQFYFHPTKKKTDKRTETFFDTPFIWLNTVIVCIGSIGKSLYQMWHKVISYTSKIGYRAEYEHARKK